MRIQPVAFDHPHVSALIQQVQQIYVRLYGEADLTPTDPVEFAPPRGLFLLGDYQGVGCCMGGWRAHHEPTHHGILQGDAEIKRMFVVPEMQGKGFARGLLAELERTAAIAGCKRMILETGTQQPEAIGLYVSSGYHEIEKFGYYRHEPDSRCYAKVMSE